ncbi:MAG: phenylalanine--tRNA ligase subunit alpha, partial [Sphingomonadaceae bacterium]|nr:phenylalanine--tRNA ligase subunit alpha [Sphingomonadaceae bacterium]
MSETKSDPDALKAHLAAAIDATTSLESLEAVRVHALGKNGAITQLLKTLGGMTPEQRQTEGPRINGLRAEIGAAIETRRAALDAQAIEARLA